MRLFSSSKRASRRLRDWTQAGVWPFILAHLHQELGRQGRINWERAALDSSLVPTKKGLLTGPNPCDRGRAGSKHHLLIDGNGLPLAVALTAANVADTTTLEMMLEACCLIAFRFVVGGFC